MFDYVLSVCPYKLSIALINANGVVCRALINLKYVFIGIRRVTVFFFADLFFKNNTDKWVRVISYFLP